MRALVPIALVALLAAPLPASSQGSDAAASAWTVSARAEPAALGKPAALGVRLVARDGFHINEEYPLNFRPATSAMVDFTKPRFDKEDGLVLEPCAAEGKDACSARLPVTFTAKASGTLTVAGTLNFSVCNPEKCLIEQVALAVPVDVAAP